MAGSQGGLPGRGLIELRPGGGRENQAEGEWEGVLGRGQSSLYRSKRGAESRAAECGSEQEADGVQGTPVLLVLHMALSSQHHLSSEWGSDGASLMGGCQGCSPIVPWLIGTELL